MRIASWISHSYQIGLVQKSVQLCKARTVDLKNCPSSNSDLIFSVSAAIRYINHNLDTREKSL